MLQMCLVCRAVHLFVLAIALSALVHADQAPAASKLAIGHGSLLHAHNCYPERGQWGDRIERALSTGPSPIAIEQDVMWVAPAAGRPGRSVVAHDTPPVGDEPTLEQYFFERVRPIVER